MSAQLLLEFGLMGLLLLLASAVQAASPYASSPVIDKLSIDASRISLGAGDNWPITWADDGDLYTVYCDGEGWEERRFSMGMARVQGSPPDISGENIPSPSGERGPDDTGYGKKGRKACGMLMVDGVLYMWVRNFKTDGTGSILAWSSDRARTWTWASWAFEQIGYPVWLNFGQNYAGARDEFLYFYSPESASAYAVTDTIGLARVPKGRAQDQQAYEFFAGLDQAGKPTWSRVYGERRPVFGNPGRCYRPEVVYNPGIRRYLLCTATKEGHLGIFDAPEPWGPWTTAYFNDEFGAGEDRFQPRIPTKWIRNEGRTFALVYSCYPKGPYQFNVQEVSVHLARNDAAPGRAEPQGKN